MLSSMVEPKEWYFEVTPWSCRRQLRLSSFDIRLRNQWQDAFSKGTDIFLHGVETEPSRIPGSRGFVAALCRNRASKKRKAQSFTEMKQELNPKSFNFTKVKKEEILLSITTNSVEPEVGDLAAEACESKSGVSNAEDTSGEKARFCTSVIVNNSPYEFAHSLLVPEMQSLMIQSVTLDAIKMGIEVLLRSSHPGFRVMYNSLCGGASVNHLHLHCYYTEYWLHSEAFRMKPLLALLKQDGCDCNHVQDIKNHKGMVALDDCFMLDFQDSCVRGFGFAITKQNFASTLPLILYRIVQYFNEKSIPHNIVIIRGLPPSTKYISEVSFNNATDEVKPCQAVVDHNPNIPTILDDSPPYLDTDTIDNVLKHAPLIGRVYLFPRVPLYGEKSYRKFLVNVTELFGHLHFGDVDVFNAMTENDIVNALNRVSLSENEFSDIKNDVVNMLTDKQF